LSLAKYIASSPGSPVHAPSEGANPRGCRRQGEGKPREGEALRLRIRSRRCAGAQKIVLRSDFVVVPP
jgi:hypothetical protein